jgi:predicted Zn-dependent peptidase
MGLAYAIDAFAETYDDAGLVGVYAGCAAKDAIALAEVTAGEIHALATSVGDEELARAKAQLKASLFMARESLAARAEQAAAQLLAFERLLTPQEIANAIDAVRADDVTRLAQRLLAQRACAPAVLGPKPALKAAERFAAALFG